MLLDSADCDIHDDSVETRIADQQIAPASQDEQGQMPLMGKGHRLLHLRFVYSLQEIPGRSSDLQGGVPGEKNMLLNFE
jgi:hypothetical protein